jgi:hypothetical protein
MGFSPRTFGHGHSYHAVINRQFRHLVQENNAIEHDLQHCISWFDHVQRSWDLSTFEQGRMIVCNHVCGKASDSHK